MQQCVALHQRCCTTTSGCNTCHRAPCSDSQHASSDASHTADGTIYQQSHPCLALYDLFSRGKDCSPTLYSGTRARGAGRAAGFRASIAVPVAVAVVAVLLPRRHPVLQLSKVQRVEEDASQARRRRRSLLGRLWLRRRRGWRCPCCCRCCCACCACCWNRVSRLPPWRHAGQQVLHVQAVLGCKSRKVARWRCRRRCRHGRWHGCRRCRGGRRSARRRCSLGLQLLLLRLPLACKEGRQAGGHR